MTADKAAALTWLPLLLLSAVGARAEADLWCWMNASVPAPRDARVAGGRLVVAGPPEVSYPPDAYRPAPDGRGHVLCWCPGQRPCVRKCCNESMAYSSEPQCKSPAESSTVPEFAVPKFVNASGTVGAYEAHKFNLVYGKLKCSPTEKYLLEPSNQKANNFQVSENGFLLSESGVIIAPPGRFCIERFEKFKYEIAAFACKLSKEEEKVFKVPEEPKKTFSPYYTEFAMALSILFLFTTFLVYALIRDLRDLHGKCLMCHVATLLVAYSSLITVQVMSTKINDTFCVILAYTIQFTFLASFFWLNVMCYDLWSTFRYFRPLRKDSKIFEAKKFFKYSMYAWGSTFIISLSTFYVENFSNKSSDIIRPEFLVNSCWFNTKYAQLIYFFGPMGILLFSNLLMFIHTAFNIAIHIRDSKKAWKGIEINKNIDQEIQRCMLYLKLFILMGVNWLAEIVSWKLDPNDTQCVWFVMDIVNSLQGVWIFVIFVCKTRVLRLLNKKYYSQFSLFKSPTTLSLKTTTKTNISKIGNNSKNENIISMNPTNVQQLTDNKLHDQKI